MRNNCYYYSLIKVVTVKDIPNNCYPVMSVVGEGGHSKESLLLSRMYYVVKCKLWIVATYGIKLNM